MEVSCLEHLYILSFLSCQYNLHLCHVCIITVVVVIFIVVVVSDELARTPPMGWNSWNTFHCNGLNEELVKGIADALVNTGLAEAGYIYVNLDGNYSNVFNLLASVSHACPEQP